MNSQLNPPSYPDARIDQVLDALRTTEPPAGLEQRIAARLAHAAAVRTQSAASPSFFAVILNAVKDPCILLAPARFYSAAALILLIALTTLTLLHNRPAPSTQSQSLPFHTATPTRTDTPSQTFASTNTPALQVFSATRSARKSAPAPPPPSAQNLDQIALAETLAPSRAAPLQPLTAQENLMVAATRPGQPMQLAELDLARAPILRAAAKAREQANIQRYVKTLLAPFAVADALQPNNLAEPREISTAAPAPPPPTSSSN